MCLGAGGEISRGLLLQIICSSGTPMQQLKTLALTVSMYLCETYLRFLSVHFLFGNKDLLLYSHQGLSEPWRKKKNHAKALICPI